MTPPQKSAVQLNLLSNVQQRSKRILVQKMQLENVFS
jgi:hypothetical protein